MLLKAWSTKGIRRAQRHLLIRCDRCGSEYETKYSSKYATQPKHYCSRKCSQAEHQHLRIAGAKRPDVRARVEATTLERYGVKCVLALPEVHALANTPEKCRQRHLTMKERGVYFTSKPEDIFYELLCSKFGSDSVRRRVSLKTWSMDFYIETIDTFVQFDGEYWHGLDRPLEVIRESTSPRDKTILRKYEIDREQDEWFKSTGKNLLRVTDKQFARGEIPDDLR